MAHDSKSFEAGGENYEAEQFGNNNPWEVKFQDFKISGTNVDDVINAVRAAATAMTDGEDENTLEDFFRVYPGIEAKKQENIFNSEQFLTDLKAKTEEYATNHYITYGSNHDPAENERKKAKADVFYQELLDDCTEALLATDNKDATMEIIRTTLVEYRYGSGILLFPGGAETEFYYNLALRLAKKA